MKKALKILLLTGALAAILCVGAYAADATDPGVYHVTVESGYAAAVTLTPLNADGTTITPAAATLNGTAVDGFYANAEKFTLTYSGASTGSYYLVLALEGDSATPTADNVAYIDQVTADASSVTFSVYPSSLKAGSTYALYLASNAESGIGETAKVASFDYYAPYTLGDVDADGYWTANDALYTLQIAVNKENLMIGGVSTPVSSTIRLSADTDKDNYVTANDALLILQKAVGKDVF